jgi:hypothetical protein
MPPPGLQGVIFKITPPKDSVVLNLTILHGDPAFQAAVETHEAKRISAAITTALGVGRIHNARSSLS